MAGKMLGQVDPFGKDQPIRRNPTGKGRALQIGNSSGVISK